MNTLLEFQNWAKIFNFYSGTIFRTLYDLCRILQTKKLEFFKTHFDTACILRGNLILNTSLVAANLNGANKIDEKFPNGRYFPNSLISGVKTLASTSSSSSRVATCGLSSPRVSRKLSSSPSPSSFAPSPPPSVSETASLPGATGHCPDRCCCRHLNSLLHLRSRCCRLCTEKANVNN